ncbi:MAG: ComEC/Rec2 family competence protein [Candidatus Moranbacteria bacterium]|nr:ComEC/Rec2 family competence protein [Candidatus Moranbacteria bacterium]
MKEFNDTIVELSLHQKRILLFSDTLFSISLALLGATAFVLFSEGNPFIFAFIYLSLGIGIIGAFWRKCRPFIVGMFFVFFGGSLLWIYQKTDLSWADIYEGREFSDEVVIIGESIEEKTTQRIPIQFHSCLEGKCLNREAFIRTEKWETYRIGEKLSVSCMWEIPQFDEKTKTDWKRIFSARGPFLFCFDRAPVRLGEKDDIFRFSFTEARQSAEERIAHILPYPESALGGGLLFGGSSGLSHQWQEKFAHTSMTHIVAVSGYNITLLVQYFGILAITVGIRRQHSLWLSVVGIFLFIAMIGFPASGVRAGIMGILAFIAISGGAMSNALRALVMASACMVFFSPLILRYDVGFQLSVLATLGIIVGAPFIKRLGVQRLSFFPKLFSEIALTTFFAQLFVFPLIIKTFGFFSLLSFVANLCILWTLPLAMLGTLLALAISVFAIVAGKVAGIFPWILLSYDMHVIDWLSRYEKLSLSPENVSPLFILVYYFVLGGGFMWYHRREKEKRRLRCTLYESSI